MAARLLEDQALPLDQHPDCNVTSAALQSVSDPADGLNDVDGFKKPCVFLPKHSEHLSLDVKDHERWHRLAWKSTPVWVGRSNTS